MKPTVQISSNNLRRLESQERRHASPPLTDYSFQSIVESIASPSATTEKGITESRTFRKISRDFFGAEMTRDYMTEALCFAWISCVSAWPVAVAIHQLTRWMI